MPVYNSKKFLDESIKSILNQTFKDFEFIIINDCSTDKSLEIIKEYQNKDKRIKVINNKKNIGGPPSRNKGIKEAKGKYIAIMDSDDISLPKRLEKQYNYLEKNKDIFLLGTGSINISESGKKQTSFLPPKEYIKIKKILPYRNCLVHPSIMFRNNGKIRYREKFVYSEDYDLYLILLSEDKKIENIREKLIKYRYALNSIGQSKRGHQELFAEKTRKFYKERIKYLNDSYHEFEPQEILGIDINKTKNPLFIKQEIYSSFKINNFKKTKKLCKKYFKHHGIFNTVSLYYLLSFIGEKNVNSIRRLLFR